MTETEFYALIGKLDKLMSDTGLSRRSMAPLLGVSNTSLSRWFSQDPTQHRRAMLHTGRNVSQKVDKLNAAHESYKLFHVIQPLQTREKIAVLEDVLYDRVTQ